MKAPIYHYSTYYNNYPLCSTSIWRDLLFRVFGFVIWNDKVSCKNCKKMVHEQWKNNE